MGVIIGANDPLTGDYYSTWGKLRSPILGKDASGGIVEQSSYNIQYDAGSGFLTDNDTPIRFDMRYDSTTWHPGFWRPIFSFRDTLVGSTFGWYAFIDIPTPSLTTEDVAELTGETVVASGTIGTFTITGDLFTPGQLIVAGGIFTPPYPVTQPITSVGKLNAF